MLFSEHLYRQSGMDKLSRDWVFHTENAAGIRRENYTLYTETFILDSAVNDILIKGIQEGYRSMQDYVRLKERIMTATGGEYVKGMTGIAQHMVYTPYGIEEMRKKIGIVEDDECAVIPVCRSLCGTDVGQMHEVDVGTFSESRYGTTVGHEMFGIVVGVGKKGIVQIGDFVNFDSHYACEGRGHENFDDCVKSGLGCDGIVSIRGTLKEDGITRNDPTDGYFGNLVKCKLSAIPGIMSVDMAQHVVPSTLESLGNIAMIMNHIENIGLAREPENTLVVVMGVGATGHQLALVASLEQFPVIGIEKNFNRSRFAIRNGACSQIFDSAQEIEGFLQEWRKGRKNPNIVISVMSGDEEAYHGANQLLAMAGRIQFQRKVGIAFGLYGNDKSMPGDPQSRRQKDFVLSRKHFTTENGEEWWGIAGRDKEAWEKVFRLYSIAPDGQLLNPDFIAKMNRTFRLIKYPSVYSLNDALRLGEKFINANLSSSELKLGANVIN